jgi:hypothetical protein
MLGAALDIEHPEAQPRSTLAELVVPDTHDA